MIQTTEIREAMLRLSSIGLKRYEYDHTGQIFGNGPIHYLVEVSDLLFIAWENSDTCSMIVNPITRFSLDELEEVGSLEAWTVLRVPATLADGIQFREIGNTELNAAYKALKDEMRHMSSCPSEAVLGQI